MVVRATARGIAGDATWDQIPWVVVSSVVVEVVRHQVPLSRQVATPPHHRLSAPMTGVNAWSDLVVEHEAVDSHQRRGHRGERVASPIDHQVVLPLGVSPRQLRARLRAVSAPGGRKRIEGETTLITDDGLALQPGSSHSMNTIWNGPIFSIGGI